MCMLSLHDSVLMCVSLRKWVVLAVALAVYLYNSALFKLWYLRGQVEVYRLMSSMWPHSGKCVVDRRLCPVSDWGLGLVTGPGLIGWLVPPFSLPTHPPSGWGKRLPFGGKRSRGSMDGEWFGAWMARWIASLQWRRAHKHLDDHRHTHRETLLMQWSPELSSICFTDSHSHAHSAQQRSLLILSVTRCATQTVGG